MALSELAALDAAYQVLRPLNAAARRRALQWLSDALATESVLPSSDSPLESSGASSPGSGAPRRSRRRAATSSAASASAAGAPRKRATRASRAAETPKRADATARRGSRPYRRMPPVEEVMAAYRQAGSVSAMADHFGVPSHTVQGWARQLRRHGYAIGQSR